MLNKVARLHILKQIFSQNPMLYELNSNTKLITKGWKSTKELTKNGSWKRVPFMTDSLAVIF